MRLNRTDAPKFLKDDVIAIDARKGLVSRTVTRDHEGWQDIPTDEGPFTVDRFALPHASVFRKAPFLHLVCEGGVFL